MRQIITLCLLFLLYYDVTEAQTYANIPGPENVLVVYNSLDTISFLVTNYYKNARNIPTSNIVALNLPDTIITINDTTHTVGLAQQTDIIRDFDQDLNSIA
ncbi:MAG: hypothetical protein ACUVT3_13495 [Ignavibacterium sp.]